MRKWVDFVAILALSAVAVIGKFLVSGGIPIPSDIILLLFGTGIFSSVILIKIKYPLNIGNPPTSLRSKNLGIAKERGGHLSEAASNGQESVSTLTAKAKMIHT